MIKNIKKMASQVSTSLITKVTRQDSEAHISLDRYSVAIEASNAGIVEWDVAANQIFATKKCFTILNLNFNEGWIDTEQITKLFPQKEIERVVRTQGKIGANNDLRQIDTFFLDSQGNKIFIRIRGRITYNDQGKYSKFIGSIIDTTDQTRLEQRLRHEALHDFLTGLPNRTLLVNRIQHILTRLKRNSALRTALLFIDIDNFKAVNDNLGHGFGDDLLVSVGEKLAETVRASDTVSRLNGDVFVILLEDLAFSEEAQKFADRLLDSLHKPMRIQKRELNLSFSIGLVLIDDPDVSVEAVLGDADIAMHAAKKFGKGRVVPFEVTMRVQAAKRLDIESALHQAMDQDELYLAYQPIFVLKTDSPRPVGAEALLRWSKTDRGNVAPSELLDIAEENGMIGDIGLWVIRTALAQIERCLNDGYPKDFYININLSARHFDDYEIVDYLLDQIDARNLPRSSLRIEIVENAVIRNPDKALGVIERLKTEGIHVSIDDFGTGFSSLSYLHRFPFYALKIDRSFIEDVISNKATQDIVTAIIVMAGKLGIKVVAEGIESKEQLDFLRRVGCELGQGFLLAMPEVSSSLDKFFLNQSPENIDSTPA